MNGKQFVLTTLFALMLLIVAFAPVSTQQTGSYDPFVDVNGDGTIDIYDLISLGTTYGASGDPTRNVNTTNLWELDCYYRLSIESVVDTTWVAAGNSEPAICYLIVSYQGIPVSNLTSDNFTITVINTPLGGPMGGLSFMFGGEPVEGTGVYAISITPDVPSGQKWLRGSYVFVVNVTASPKTGSTNSAKGINSPNLLVT